MTSVVWELVILFFLVAINGSLAMSEMAIVSSRKARLRQSAEQGSRQARLALQLAESPNRFLATIQVGITLVGILAGAFGGATLADQIGTWLALVPPLAPYATALGLGIVVSGVTFLSLVFGELVPKRLALAHPEFVAMRVARPLDTLSRVVSPAVRVLSALTDGVLRLFRLKPQVSPSVSEDEIHQLMREGLRAGVFLPSESAMVEGVLQLDRLTVRDLMTPRGKIIWINVKDTHEAIWHKIVVSRHTHFPVYEGNRDNVVGVISVKAIYAHLAAGIPVRVEDLMTPPLIVPATQTAVVLLESFKRAGKYMALVIDEFGSVVGLVTLHDVLEAVLGELPSPDDRARPTARRREDGSWLVDAMMDIDNFERQVPELNLGPREARDFSTFAGFVIKQLGHVPQEGESFRLQNFRVEVIDMDRHRVDKVLLIPDGWTQATPRDEHGRVLPGGGGGSAPSAPASPGD